MKVMIEGQIDGEFFGWNENAVFRLTNGQLWQQISNSHKYHYAYCPKAFIFKDRAGETSLAVEGMDESVTVKKLLRGDYIESRIDGEFFGWSGDTEFRLTSGQVWRQIDRAYTYYYANNPKIIIYRGAGCYIMRVEGVESSVQVKRTV